VLTHSDGILQNRRDRGGVLSRAARIVGIAVIATVAAGWATVALAGPADADEAVVVRVVDGDTFDAKVNGRLERIRLLNIDTPETKDPNRPQECLGPEATAHLNRLIPQGAVVQLKYDVEREDRYGRTLAAVFTEDGVLVNRSIAAAGLGRPVVVGENRKFFKDVLEGQQAAQGAQVGFYSEEIACTVPGQVAATSEQMAAAMPSEATAITMSPQQLDSAAAEVAATAAAASWLLHEFDQQCASIAWTVLTPARRGELREGLQFARSEAVVREVRLKTAAGAARLREEEARPAAEAEAARLAAQKAEAAAEARRAAAKQADDAKRSQQEPSSTRSTRSTPSAKSTTKPKPKSSSGSGGSGGSYPGYTGPRCYAPGGKSWRPCP
jgi:micrococcal nuclease